MIRIFLELIDPGMADLVTEKLRDVLPEDFPVTVITVPNPTQGEEQGAVMPLKKLATASGADIDKNSKPADCADGVLGPLLAVMTRLLGEGGCPWDKQQTHHSLRQYLIEESYEVLEAIDENNMHKLCEELGDLLLQIVFHAQLAQQRGDFTIKDVVDRITEKMIRRHPHVFGDVSVRNSDEVIANWQEIKKREKGFQGPESELMGIPQGLPALLRAMRLQERAARVGFDWDEIEGAWHKAAEEIEELKQAQATGNPDDMEAEMGDLLFAIVNVGRFLGIEPETALNRTNGKFTARFNFIEEQAWKMGRSLTDMTLSEMDKLWNEAKKLVDYAKTAGIKQEIRSGQRKYIYESSI